ncbi:MAG TPA: UDP-N-acetylmuramate:L-alanyl-gamma-D-glutamyl-meso-diaminopimelate ligase [Solirubrobacter sp.]|jgi:UDP-N-acetylmuramate: L-alanyl-gamma-D-glutamyl-meso-diaminopimelate ligase|nr:UDP-N-acetylmuramate:L-alanyl-gamma-D-glutamyl-meso-diaminopimelate ligase [Solirubrobacter sp.]
MHLHILGICGTFMGGIAALARAAGHRVTGSDGNVYPPMSTQLEGLGISLIEGYGPAQLDLAPDVVVVGNVMTRGMPVIERLLEGGLPYVSGPQWLAENFLRGREVLAVAGTHGKTTTSSMLAWILEDAGRDPGFLIGGIPANFGASARAGAGAHFVIEADEYDTAFFDKRAKFVHYRPRHLLLTNLEHDHADIYPDLAAIQRQVHHLVRTVPGTGRITWNAASPALRATLAMGAWTPLTEFAREAAAEWRARLAAPDGSAFEVLHRDAPVAVVRWPLIGLHNVENGLAAVAAAAGAGVLPAQAAAALGRFAGVRRRLELRGEAGGVRVFDDFAHHPTAIALTIDGVRRQPDPGRIVAVLEPRSNTMRLGLHREELAESLAGADGVWLYQPAGLDWNLDGVAAALGGKARVVGDIPALVAALAAELRAGDRVLVMSNGGFGGLHDKLLAALRGRAA